MSPDRETESHKRKRTCLALGLSATPVAIGKCDGRRPSCTTCTQGGTDCVYGAEAINKSKSDMILDVAIRSEGLLLQLSAQLVRRTLPEAYAQASHRSPANISSVASPGNAISPSTLSNLGRGEGPSDHISNAILSPFHASTTESILSWPHFGEFRSLIKEKCTQNTVSQAVPPQPYMAKRDIGKTFRDFERGINCWYPTMARSTTKSLKEHLLSGAVEYNTRSCLALLVMALGCSSELVRLFTTRETPEPHLAEVEAEKRLLGSMYFECAFDKIHLAQAEFTADAVQCLFFTGYVIFREKSSLHQGLTTIFSLYFSFLQRPLQAWSFISAAAIKCRLLLSYTPSDQPPERLESLHRIFWSCYILESDFLAELSALPQTGIAEIESLIPLPGEYSTQESQSDQEKSSLYFLACISMRRLLNRVHDLLYARNDGVGFDNNQFPSVVSELGHQLEEWKDLLPFHFQFSVDLDPTKSPEGAFLRQRYLTCKSVIYRPYLTWALSNGEEVAECPPIVFEGSRLCLEACWMHAQNLRNIHHTIMVDTWICSLSMASVVLITLAASRVHSLRQLISHQVIEIGPHINDLITRWMYIPGDEVSPSVLESTKLIANVSALLKLSRNQD
ncbi:hypothetical protein N7471_013617 [Penicillium samsonianum]|uniref:uncharacterized protein n=1 Tax=Penicillium samsonianum TaxID=1882272 RepID=UPI0025492579|nr:uncharacterized protein N7471_013617 [Penicillium samsonianum]KAJ6118997.1 hypothetical protein N7471_013617 [Penicillium samsonianum]